MDASASPRPLLLTDDDVLKHLTPTEACAVMEGVLLARARGQLESTPRWRFPFRQQAAGLVFTVGAVPQGVGFRAYLTGHFPQNEQLVALWHPESGALRGLVVGELLGALRTGAIGGVAVKYMAAAPPAGPAPASPILALIGTGRQAYFQLRAVAALRPLRAVRVYSRNPAHREAFCADMRQLLPQLDIQPSDSAEAAVRGAQIVICATNSRSPVLEGAWLEAGAQVTTVGPKGRELREVDAAVVARADFIASDSPEQLQASEYGSLLDGIDKPLHDLAALVSGQQLIPADAGIRLFISAGLAGTEVALAARLCEKAAARDTGA